MKNQTTIKITGLPSSLIKLSLYNLLGQEVFKTSFIGKKSKDIEIPILSSGIYIANLKSEHGILSKKIKIN